MLSTILVVSKYKLNYNNPFITKYYNDNFFTFFMPMLFISAFCQVFMKSLLFCQVFEFGLHYITATQVNLFCLIDVFMMILF